jgi:hypothetical protein
MFNAGEMDILLKKISVIVMCLGLMMVSCDLSEDTEQILPPPAIPERDIFELDFTGITSAPTGYKEINHTGLVPGTLFDTNDAITIEDPFRLALGLINDFRRGMMSQLSSIFQATFHNVNKLVPDETDGMYVWHYSSNIFDPGLGYPMQRSDLKLTADRKMDGSTTWRLFKTTENDQILIALGESGNNHLKGEWIFFYHDAPDVPAYQFNWVRRKEKTAIFESKLHFANVETTYQQNGDWVIHTQDRQESVQNSLFAEVRWNRRTGEGSVYVRIDSMNEDIKRCWNSLREPIDDCPAE